MRLLNLKLENYRRFNNVEIDFPDGVTGIIGSNGSGKSSLVESIAWTIYGTSRSAKEEIISTGNGADYCQSILTLEIDAKQYEIVRQISGKNATSKMAVFTTQDGEKIKAANGVKASEEFLVSLIGMDQHSFETSFFAKQHQLNALSDLQSSTRKQRIIKMLKIDVIDKAKELLKKDLAADKAKAEGISLSIIDPNVIKVQLIELEKQLKQVSKSLEEQVKETKRAESLALESKKALEIQSSIKDKYMKLRIEYRETAAGQSAVMSSIKNVNSELNHLEQFKNELKKLEPQLEKGRLFEEKLAAFESLKNRFHNYQVKKSKYDSLNKELTNLNEEFDKLKTNKTHLEAISKELKELSFIDEQQKYLEQMRSETTKLENDEKHYRQAINEINNRLNNLESLKGEERCPTCLGPIKGKLPEIRTHFEKEKESLDQKIMQTVSHRKELQKEIEVKQKDLDKRSKARKDLEEKSFHYRQEIKKFETITQKKSALESSIKELGLIPEEIPVYNAQEHKDISTKAGEYKKLAEQALVLKTKISAEDRLKKDLENLNKELVVKTKRLESVKKQGESLGYDEKKDEQLKEDFDKKQSVYHENRIKLNNVENEHKSKLKEKERLEAEHDNLLKQQKMLKEIKERNKELSSLVRCFDDFKKELIGRIRPVLSQKAGSLMAALTDGRYNHLELTNDYDIMLYDGNQQFLIERFSGGEKDLANLCLRIAISELMAESSRSDFNFIILDEVFGSQDSIRKNNIIKALQNLSKRFRQLFVITHVEDIKDMVDSLIEVRERDEGFSVLKMS